MDIGETPRGPPANSSSSIGHEVLQWGHTVCTFSKVVSVVGSYSKCTWALTFLEWGQGGFAEGGRGKVQEKCGAVPEVGRGQGEFAERVGGVVPEGCAAIPDPTVGPRDGISASEASSSYSRLAALVKQHEQTIAQLEIARMQATEDKADAVRASEADKNTIRDLEKRLPVLPREQEGMREGADERGGAVDPPPRPAANDWYRREAGGGGGAGAGGDQERTSAWARDEAQEVRAELDGMQQQAMLMQIQQQQQQQAAMMQQQQKQQQQQAMIQQGYAAFNAQWMIDQYVREKAMNAAELEVALSNLFNVELKSGTASRQRLESILLVTTGSGGGLGADDLEDCVALFHLVSIGVCDAKEQADVLGTNSKEFSL